VQLSERQSCRLSESRGNRLKCGHDSPGAVRSMNLIRGEMIASEYSTHSSVFNGKVALGLKLTPQFGQGISGSPQEFVKILVFIEFQ
jgi:hypothetical protein